MSTSLFYAKDKPEFFRFFSDSKTASLLKYDKCQLQSIESSLPPYADFYFGCSSSQLIKATNNQDMIMYYGNSGHVLEFDDISLYNDKPDYLIEFPFNIDNIGRAYRKAITRNGDGEQIQLDDWYASHYRDAENTLITEWGDSPSIYEFRFIGHKVFKRTSFEKMSLNWRISDEWMKNKLLVRNIPSSFVIELKIPKSYNIEDIDQYEVLEDTHGSKDLEEFLTIKIDLVKDRSFHLILVDPIRLLIKQVMQWVCGTIIAGMIIYPLINKKLRKEINKLERK